MIPKFSGLLAGIAVVALSSCSSVYKSGQTPDDVYYSPGKPVAAAAKGEDYVETNKRSNYNKRNTDRYYDDYNYRDDQYMRMMINSGRRPYWYYDDFAMMDPWMYNNWRWNSYMTWNSPWNSPYNSMWYWNSFYNPYCRPIYVIPTGGFPGKPGYGNVVTRPSRPVSAFGMSSYLNTNSNNNRGYKPSSYYRGGSYNNSNNREYNSGTSRRSLFSGNSNSNSSYDRPSRSYSPSSNSGSSSGSRSSSGSSGGGVSRPARTGN